MDKLTELFYATNQVFYTSGNRFVRRTGTFGNLIFSLVPSDNRYTRSTCPTSVFTDIGQTLMSRPDHTCITHWSWCAHVSQSCVTWPWPHFQSIDIYTLSSRNWVNFYITILPRLSIFGHQIVHGGYISTSPVCQWLVVFGYCSFLHQYNWNVFIAITLSVRPFTLS